MVLLRYREHFHLDYWQAFFTPYRVMVRDLELLSLEASIKNTYRAQKLKQKTGKIK